MKTILASEFGAYCDALEIVIYKAPIPRALDEIHQIGIDETIQAFVTKRSPQGDFWPQRQNVGDGHPLLVLSGSLGQAATGGLGHTILLGERTLAYGVDLDAPRLGVPQEPWKHGLEKVKNQDETLTYARAQAYGYPDNNLPARNFMGMGEEAIKKSAVVIMDDLSEQIREIS